MSQQTLKKTTTLALGAAMVATLAAAPVQADVNPFGMTTMSSGYMVAGAKDAEGKCGADKAAATAQGEGKSAEAKCGADKATAKPIQEAKCGEAKCGSNK